MLDPPPSYSCTILQQALEVTEDTFTPFNVFWLLLSWILSFCNLESGDFRLHPDSVFMECLGKTLLSSIQFPLGVCHGLLPPPQLSCQDLPCCSQVPQQTLGLGHVAHTTACTGPNGLLVCL